MANQSRGKYKHVTDWAVDRLKHDIVSEGLISREKLEVAEMRAERDNVPLSRVLIESGIITGDQLFRFIGDKIHIPYVNLRSYAIDRRLLDLIPERIARRYSVIPLFKIEDVLTIAMSDPLHIISVDEMSAVARCKVEPVLASAASIENAIDQWYGMGSARRGLIEEFLEDFKEVSSGQEEEEAEGALAAQMRGLHLKMEAEEAPIIRLVNSCIVQAMMEDASDIHLEPKRDHILIRFRIDGFLYDRERLPSKLIAPVVSRIKIMSGLDISKWRVPQDGRIGIVIRDRNIDVRTSTFPTMYGEKCVLRILDRSRGAPALSELGLSPGDLKTFERMIKATKGIILSTGPTGSGKTTTIYSAISTVNTGKKNIMTIEDPIEYEINGIVQGQVNAKAGVTFATALRSILRQDPDLIYVGEIRDLETAEIAVRSALTGHLVLSTLHTNDAVGTITRLSDIGVEPNLIASVLNCCFAQRLVRRLCPKCTRGYTPKEGLLKRLGLPPDAKLQRSEGCDACGRTGYRGRIGIFEILVVTEEIKKLITEGATADELLKVARAQGMVTLFEDGLQKVAKGITTLDEVERVTGD